ncbi:hypothetical protein Leryth_011140 [Lithospermum erythrorhizon]|nr:hypothetical protein Leryth_011140 [Lithospermum erythrorhizon]
MVGSLFSSLGTTHLVNLKKEVFLKGFYAKPFVVSFAKFHDFSCISKNGHFKFGRIRKNGFLVMGLLNDGPEAQSDVTVTVVSKESNDFSVGKDVKNLEGEPVSELNGENGKEGLIDGNGGNGNVGGIGGGGGGGGGNGGDGEFDEEEKEFGPLLKFEEVIRETEARGASLPADMLEAAKSIGIRKLLLLRYLDMQASGWPLGFAMRSWSMLRNRMLADPSFLFKIGTEIVIDSCCATFAEVQKRGKDFWAEFELYTADLLVGVVVNVALVGMLAPYVRIGQPSASQGLLGRLQRAYGALPSSVFEAQRPGCQFTVNQRIATYFYKVMHADRCLSKFERYS